MQAIGRCQDGTRSRRRGERVLMMGGEAEKVDGQWREVVSHCQAGCGFSRLGPVPVAELDALLLHCSADCR